jgi:heterodisulfide reductase subunit B
LERINWFTEQEYKGKVHVAHFLELLRDDLGWDALAERVTRPLDGLKVAPYYGCLLLRPYEEIGLDNPESPTILHDLMRALGAEPVDFPYSVECCGSYLIVKEPRVPEKIAHDIVTSAREHGAQAIITACPLCQFNLEYPQRETEAGRTGDEIPVLYFTQLMAMALDLPEEDWGVEDHYVDPLPAVSVASEQRVNQTVPQTV